METFQSESPNSFQRYNHLIDKKLSLGRYHFISFIILGIVLFSDGAEILCLSILVPVIRKEWNISIEEQSTLGSILFAGILVGSIVSGLIADRLGRRAAIMYSSLLQFCVGLGSAYANNISIFILLRGFFGVAIGFTMPLSPTFATEIAPTSIRGQSNVALNAFFTVGKFFCILVASISLETLSSGNWRALLIWCSVPCFFVFLGALVYLKESPRFLFVKGKSKAACDILDEISKINGNSTLTAEDRDFLFKYSAQVKPSTSKIPLQSLFTSEFKRITCCLWTIWFSLNFVYYGMVFILPYILAKIEEDIKGSQSGFMGLFYTSLGELPSVAVAYFILENKYFGRKYTVIYANLLSVIVYLICILVNENKLVFLITIIKFFTKLSFIAIYPFTSELYPTDFRTSGMGFASAFGRIGSVLMPYVLLELYNIDMNYVFWTFTVGSTLLTLGAFFTPYDTCGKMLDSEINVALKERLLKINRYQ